MLSKNSVLRISDWDLNLDINGHRISVEKLSGDVALRIATLPVLDEKLICAFALSHETIPRNAHRCQINLFNFWGTSES